jgi:hypothetical protein
MMPAPKSGKSQTVSRASAGSSKRRPSGGAAGSGMGASGPGEISGG